MSVGSHMINPADFKSLSSVKNNLAASLLQGAVSQQQSGTREQFLNTEAKTNPAVNQLLTALYGK